MVAAEATPIMATERAGSKQRCSRAILLAAALVQALPPPPSAADGIGNENAPPQEICGTCHGLHGISRMAKFPMLAGQRADYIEKQVRDFREGRRSNDGGQMATVVTEISEQQMAEVAAYFTAQPPPQQHVRLVEVSVSGRAALLYEVGDAAAGVEPCRSCHGPAAGPPTGGAARAPLLGSQHESYIAKQLADFRSGSRDNDEGGRMRRIAAALSDADIAALARFLAAMPRAMAGQH
jgi:cytochrome c553